jgi:hypothetical protein
VTRSTLALLAAAAVTGGVALAVAARPAPPRAAAPARGEVPTPPPTLRETGLYADWNARTIAPGVAPFVPQYPLWTDGATKRRWIALPPGAAIDASDPDAWQLPVGTRLWKEFSVGRVIETRYMERGAGGWAYATYVWNEAGTEATLAPARGAATDVALGGGATYTIPSHGDCLACHASGPTAVLGFSALQLSPDRDPLAPHRAPPPAGAIDLVTLLERDQLRGLPAELPILPPRIAARTPTERAALGYLHGNCGGCHRDDGPLASLGLVLANGEALRTAVGRPSRFGAPALRIAAGAPDASVLVTRLRSRAAATQMPPIGTAVVDDEAVRLIATWIEALD